jgi:1,2-dihydroxy-3-keto-5-methylthiopentene dioxygenase
MQAFRLNNQQTVVEPQELLSNGIFYQRLSESEEERRAELNKIKTEQGYIDEDIVELNSATPDLDTISTKFDKEHLHTSDEVRFVLDGAGIFDIRDLNDQWIRVEVHQNDLLIVPANRHHRFMLTDARQIRCLRLFQDKKGWSPIYRTLATSAS